jgi:hypothetical protein
MCYGSNNEFVEEETDASIFYVYMYRVKYTSQM